MSLALVLERNVTLVFESVLAWISMVGRPAAVPTFVA